MRRDFTPELIEICLKTANIVDERQGFYDGSPYPVPYSESLRLGSRAYTHYLREGAKSVIDLQRKYYMALEREKLARIGEETSQNFLEDIFGDRDVETVPDEYKEKFKALLKKMDDEWEEKDGSRNTEQN